MALQIKLTNRRQFLERSMLGFGSAFVLPSLLASCTDHIIPPPVTPPPFTPPRGPFGAIEFDWDVALKKATIAGLGAVPEVGGFLGPLADILWPGESQPSVWDQIKDQVEALIKQDIDATVYGLVSDKLTGLNNRITYYRQALKANDSAQVINEWENTRDAFGDAQGLFQDPNNQLLLLPLFAQFATLYLSILRDPVIDANFHRFWSEPYSIVYNRNDIEQQQDITNLQGKITEFTKYVNDTYNAAFPANSDWGTRNSYTRQMTLTVLDYMGTWQYYDYMTYPAGAKDLTNEHISTMPLEIYSDAYGEIPGGIVTPSPTPTAFPSKITVWGYDRIDGVQVFYPLGISGAPTGPQGQFNTPRMGDQSGGQIDTYGGVFITDINDQTKGPITQARARGYQFVPMRNEVPCVYTLQFMYNNGTETNPCGGANLNDNLDKAPNNYVSYPNHALSSVYIPGVSSFDGIGSANCIIFGFRYWQAPDVTKDAIRDLYVKSPKEKSVADYAKAFPKLGITADLINDELKAARKKYWEAIEAWVKAHK